MRGVYRYRFGNPEMSGTTQRTARVELLLVSSYLIVSVARILRRPLLGVSSPQSSTLNSTDSVPNSDDRLSTFRSFRKETRRTVTQIFLSIRDAIARTIASQVDSLSSTGLPVTYIVYVHVIFSLDTDGRWRDGKDKTTYANDMQTAA